MLIAPSSSCRAQGGVPSPVPSPPSPPPPGPLCHPWGHSGCWAGCGRTAGDVLDMGTSSWMLARGHRRLGDIVGTGTPRGWQRTLPGDGDTSDSGDTADVGTAVGTSEPLPWGHPRCHYGCPPVLPVPALWTVTVSVTSSPALGCGDGAVGAGGAPLRPTPWVGGHIRSPIPPPPLFSALIKEDRHGDSSVVTKRTMYGNIESGQPGQEWGTGACGDKGRGHGGGGGVTEGEW